MYESKGRLCCFNLSAAQHRPFQAQFLRAKNNAIFSAKKRAKKLAPYRPNMAHILEPPGPFTTLGFSWMCPAHSTWNVWLHWCVGTPPFMQKKSHALGCVGMRCHSPYYWKLLEPPTLGFCWMCPAPQYLKCIAALMAGPPPSNMTNRKPAVGVGELVAMGWWRKVNLCSTLWVRLLKASDTIRLWNSMFDKKQKLKELYGMGRVGLDQHTSTIFSPRLNLKKHPFGTVQSWKNVRKRHPNNR